MVLKKYEIEAALHAEKQDIAAGRLKEDNPLDVSEEFRILCEACRRGDLKACQEKIQEGVNINARDRFDYTPLILASLCGHFEVVQLLLESGALCERDTFQGERCLYNALNDRIRNLLLSYDYSKSRDPLQPLAGHITSLLNRTVPDTSDIRITTDASQLRLHKFLLASRSPYFEKKLAAAPETTSWRIHNSIPTRSVEIAMLALYFGEVGSMSNVTVEDQAILGGIEKLGRQLEIGDLLANMLESDRRIARQRRSEEIERARDQLAAWFQKTVLAKKMEVSGDMVQNVKWDRENSLFADVLLCATDELTPPPTPAEDEPRPGTFQPESTTIIPIGTFADSSSTAESTPTPPPTKCTLFPAHRAMLIRADYFYAMFCSPFREAQLTAHLPIIHMDCSPAVLSIILTYIYTERSTIPLELALDVLFAADQLLIEKLKVKAAMIISTLGNGAASVVEADNSRGDVEDGELVDIYDVVRAGWDTRVHRLEEFGARYIAYRLEKYIDQDEFKELVRESAARIQRRQETDTVELVDDIRYYLSERFRLRFEDADLEDMLNETQKQPLDASDPPALQDSKSDPDATKVASSGDATFADPGVIRTLDGDIAGDEFAQDALNYQILLGKIDKLLDELRLDA